MLDARAIRTVGGLALGAALVLAGVPAESGAQQQRAGFQAHVDPETGELVERPPRLPRSSSTPSGAEPETAAETPEALDLQEEPAPAGGVTVELRGAFRSSVRATLAPGGAVDTRCDGGHAPAAGKASE